MSPSPKRRCPPLIDTPSDLRKLVRALEREPVIGVDAEMDSFYSYFEKICLLQFSTPDADFLVDALAGLDLAALGPVLADPGTVKVFHAAENDVPYFRGHLGLEIRGLFDTYLAARVLGYPRCGLAGLLEEHFQVRLDKRFQMADWRVRPLPREQAEYARMDTRYLIPLREILLGQLEESGRLAQAESEFRKAEAVEYAPRTFDPDGWLKIRGARTLSPVGRRVLQALYRWRDETARNQGVPPFRVLPDRALVAVARRGSAEALTGRSRRYRRVLRPVLEEAVRQGPLPPPAARGRRSARLSPREQDRYQRLREWRNRRCRGLKVEADRVASNRLLREVARRAPTSLEELSRVPGMDEWRLQDYGREILEVLGHHS